MQYFSVVVVGIMTVFAIVGILDSLFLKDKLGLGAEFRIHAVEAVIDHVPVVAGDVRRRPDRIEAGEVRLGHMLQHAVLGGLGECGASQGGSPGGGDQVTALHVLFLWTGHA